MPRGNMTPKKMMAMESKEHGLKTKKPMGKMMAMEAKEHGMKMKKASGRGPAIGGYSEAKPSMKKPAKKRVDNMGAAPMKGKKSGGLMIAIAIGKPKKRGMK